MGRRVARGSGGVRGLVRGVVRGVMGVVGESWGEW